MEPPASIAPFHQDTPPIISFMTGEYNGPKQRQFHASNVHNHCISVSVEDWFATCIETPEKAKWSSEEASSVVKALRNNMDHKEDGNFLLDSDGWKSLNVALSRKDLTEDQVYRTIAKISKADITGCKLRLCVRVIPSSSSSSVKVCTVDVINGLPERWELQWTYSRVLDEYRHTTVVLVRCGLLATEHDRFSWLVESIQMYIAHSITDLCTSPLKNKLRRLIR